MRKILGLAAAALMLAAGPALAKHRHHHRGYQERAAAPHSARYAPGGVCTPWCPFDLSPCDPPQFKISDGRCSSPVSTGGGAYF